MRWIRTPTRPCRPRSIVAWPAYALLALLAYPYAPRPALAATPSQETLIQALFGDSPATESLDANGDGAVTVADIVGLLFAGTIAEFVPHAVGDQLVYRVTDPMGTVTTETTLVTSSDVGGAFVVDDQEVNGQQIKKHETQSYTDTGSQLFFGGGTDVLRDLRTACTPPLLRLTTPVVAGQMFSTTVQCEVRIVSRDIFVGFINRTDTFTPIDLVDSVTVPAGTYTQVVHISGTTNLSGDLETDEIYIAPGVGVIKQLSIAGGQTTKHELSVARIGGPPVAR